MVVLTSAMIAALIGSDNASHRLTSSDKSTYVGVKSAKQDAKALGVFSVSASLEMACVDSELVFKTSGGYEQCSQWVRFPYTPASRFFCGSRWV